MPNLHMLLKQKSASLSRNLALETFGELLIVFSTKVNLLYLTCSMAQRCCLLHLINQNCLLKTFLRTQFSMTQVSLCLFSLLELIWNCITPKMVKNVITNLDSSKASGLDCILVAVLKNCEPEFSYILAELCNMCQEELCFPDFPLVSHWWSLYLRMLGKDLLLKTTALLVFFLWLVKSLKNL